MPDGASAAARGNVARAPTGQHLLVSVTDERGRPVRVPRLASWLSRIAPARARGSVNVALVSDARIRELNRRYRRKDRATDVLSFPAGPILQPGPSARRVKRAVSTAPLFLGDLVIARGVARRQAHEAGHDELTELKILSLHGLLHLLGYDHERDAGRMLRVERRLRRKGGLREGLIERERPGSR
jgi:probable rRNA maturation factor